MSLVAGGLHRVNAACWVRLASNFRQQARARVTRMNVRKVAVQSHRFNADM
jgi:hypothetical protein